MTRTSEWVSLGHPDKMADYISSYLLDRYIERDPLVRFAVEVMIKGNNVFLGGEVTCDYDFDEEDIRNFVAEAVREIGYTRIYTRDWGHDNTISCDSLNIISKITQQSSDIAQGVNNEGWGDQGIFWGMATKETVLGMPLDHAYARSIGKSLFDNARTLKIGLDIKTQVTMERDKISQIIIAAPMQDLPHGIKKIRQNLLNHIHDVIGPKHADAQIIINGTGAYSIHGPRADAGVTGRKLVVDFYGGNCRIGGGSPWTKDPTKADLTLNLYARHLALQKLREMDDSDSIKVAISCCIGSKAIDINYFDENHALIGSEKQERSINEIIDLFNLRQPTYAKRCREGLFFDI